MPINFSPTPPAASATPGVPVSDHPSAPPYPAPGDEKATYLAYYRFWIGVIRSVLADNTVPDAHYSYRGQALSRWSHPDLRSELTAMQSSLHLMDTGLLYLTREYE